MYRRNFLMMTASAAVLTPLAVRKARAATTHKVKIRGFRFSPRELEVRVGDTIEFENRDSTPHTATANNQGWDTGALDFGGKENVQVTADMDAGYFCRFHPGMKGKLKISA